MNSSKLLALVVCAAGPASQATKLVASAQKRGWAVQLRITNPAHELVANNAAEFAIIEAQSERGEPDAIIIAPASFNTINKLSGGISDEHHLDFLHPRIKRIPTVILPFVNKGYADREVYRTSLERLRNEGISIMEIKPHEVGKGDAEVDHFPWDAGLDTIDNLMNGREHGRAALEASERS